MCDAYQTRLQRLAAPENCQVLAHIQRGIEKEGLRVTPQATVAQTGHPQALGAALTHASITTDYSEALLEFITPVFARVDDSVDYLNQLHRYTLANIGAESLWPASMPCRLAGDESIPIAQYGDSNPGQMKHVYRQGLAHRYGRIMQSIAGIHYNFSLPDAFWPICQSLWGSEGDLQAFKSERYFGLIRNVQRHSWLLSYLFGASPVLDSSFMEGKPHQLHQLSENTLGLPFATSLRMSDLGYQSQAQDSLKVSYRDLDSYLNSLGDAVRQSHPEYEKIGVKEGGQYRQLNTHILQIENEYYSDIRPKRVMRPGEKPIEALRARGVEYVEVRILDINPFLPVGIDAEQIRFLDAFLLHCLLTDSDEISATESAQIRSNQQQVILQGRKPSLMLRQAGKPVSFCHLAEQLLNEIDAVAALLDKAQGTQADNSQPHSNQSHDHPSNNHPSHGNPSHNNQSHRHALSAQREKVKNSELTPSGRMMGAIAAGASFAELMLTQAKKQQAHFAQQPLAEALNAEFQRLARASLQQQRVLEASDQRSFDDYLHAYWASSVADARPKAA